MLIELSSYDDALYTKLLAARLRGDWLEESRYARLIRKVQAWREIGKLNRSVDAFFKVSEYTPPELA